MTRMDDPAHHRWLATEASRLISFHRHAVDPAGGFCWLDDHGRAIPGEPTYLWITTRMVHCFALAHLLGDSSAARLVDHGLAALHGCLRDPVHGGWFWSAGPDGPVDDSKHAYGHAFVLLAACSAVHAGRPAARRLMDEAIDVIDQRFWRDSDRLCVDSYSRDWQQLAPYRGANANMHMTEAFLAAAEATGEQSWVDRAEAIAGRIIAQATAANQWRLPEHFDVRWRPLPDYNANRVRDPFRPYGSTIGHWLEWARLVTRLHGIPRVSAEWMLPAAVTLFDKAVAEGWDQRRGGFIYTVDWAGQPVITDRMHWVLAEAIAVAVALYRATGNPRYDQWYSAFWDYAEQQFIDHRHGSWIPQLDRDGQRATEPWRGKPDLYHALQATLLARIPPTHGAAAALANGHLTRG
ncbi:MAG: AGE family epimerase/isomerase [Micromonosporaceae bacterium]|nr:AGE family epimerase/isomerase [Micromonosporaceae bacterium]